MSDQFSYSAYDAYLFHEGTHTRIYEKFGAHPCRIDSTDGIVFRVWAPNAKAVSVITNANAWNPESGKMTRNDDGIWELFTTAVSEGDLYRYVVYGADEKIRYKSDPYAFYSECRPNNASIVFGGIDFEWHDETWLNNRKNPVKQQISIYEVHPGSWKRTQDGFLNYRDIGLQLAEYVRWMGFTHVELMGICEYPFDGSWGYQVSGYYSPTSRYGTPKDFREMIDVLHENGIGVIMDWVPAHFVKDDFALSMFDGTCLYEPTDPNNRDYPEWGTCAFDFSKPEVRSFLISNALYWIREFHIDGLRVDAVVSMMYLDYGREKWTPNCYGDNRYLAGRDFLRQLNETIHNETTAMTIAEDSSIESGITAPVSIGGYGFDFKWNMGWMNDTLEYMEKDPVYRKYHHDELTHAFDYAFTEKFVLVLSHDEVVHLKKSMLGKMPGNFADRVGNLKALYALQYIQPGKKLLFMGQEFGTDSEWDENKEIEWQLTKDHAHREILLAVRELNRIYRDNPILWKWDDDPASFQWINSHDNGRNIISFIRKDPGRRTGTLIFAVNFSRTFYSDYLIGTPVPGTYERIFSTYDTTAGGGGPDETGGIPKLYTMNQPCNDYPAVLSYGLRPNEAVLLRWKE